MPLSKPHPPAFLNSRGTLLLGFGGCFLLLLYGVDRLDKKLEQARATSATMRSGFLERNQLLNQLRNDIVVEGTYLRDYLLDPNPEASASHRAHLLETESEIDALLARKEPRLTGEALERFLAAYREYRREIEPTLGWSAEQRRRYGYPMLRDRVFQKRTSILLLADAIGRSNEEQMNQSAKSLEDIYVSTREDMRRQTIGLTLVGLGLAVLTLWRITRLERERQARIEELEAARGELRELSSRLVAVQEEERKRISRELHDEVAQNLSAIRVGLERIQRREAGLMQDETETDLTEARRLAEQSLKVTRQLSSELRPSMLDDLGLVPALHWLAKEWTRRLPVKVIVEADEELEEGAVEKRVCIYRIVQEALHNAFHHGEATEVRIRATRESAGTLVSIEDNGTGFDPAKNRGMGMLGMMERVEGLGGRIQIESEPGTGTVVMAELP